MRGPRHSDYLEWASLRHESRDFLKPWEPRWAPDELERPNWRARLRHYHRDFISGVAIAYFIFEHEAGLKHEAGRLVGGITLANIRYGVSRSAQIGYWMGERYAGQGYMQDALRALLAHAFDTMRLHRIEAACIPGNSRSIRVLEKAGFTREGLARSYLCIDGIWHDHYIYARIAGEG